VLSGSNAAKHNGFGIAHKQADGVHVLALARQVVGLCIAPLVLPRPPWTAMLVGWVHSLHILAGVNARHPAGFLSASHCCVHHV
jgi:hypothetical protein